MKWILLIVGLVLLMGTTSAITNITPSEDTYVDSDNPDVNYGSSNSLLFFTSAGADRYTYLKFYVNNFSNNAELYVYCTGGYLPAGSDSIYRTSYEWNESLMTWNSERPNAEYLTSIDSVSMSTADTWYTFNVSSVVNKPGWYSFKIKAGYARSVSINSSDSGVNIPYLQVTPYNFTDIISNNKTNNDSVAFLVNQDDSIQFNISAPDISNVSNYTWYVNKVDQNNNASIFNYTVPQCDSSKPSSCIWEIRTIVTYQNSSKVYREWLISTLSESDAPDFIDYFIDRNNTDRTGYYKDPWGRVLSSYNQEENYINEGLYTDGDSSTSKYLTTDFDITHGTFKYKINNPGVLDSSMLQVYGNLGGFASRWNIDFTSSEFHDYFAIVSNEYGYIPISRRWIGQAPSSHWWKADGWHDITVVHEEDGLWSVWDNDILLPQTFVHYDNAFDNAHLLELTSNSELEMDCIEVYENKYIYPSTTISYGWYPRWWYISDVGSGKCSPINETGVNVFGRNVTLSDIANTINNASIFTYNGTTRIATTNADICLRTGTSLFISNETLIFNTSSGELDFSIKNGATLNVTDSEITATNSPMRWNIVSSVSQTIFDPDTGRNSTALGSDSIYIPFSDYRGVFIIENSIINNTGNLFLDGAEEIIINNTILRNHHDIDYGDYTLRGAYVNHNNKKYQSMGDKGLWIVPRCDLYNFILNNISFETPQTDIDLKVVGGEWIFNSTTIKNSDLSNINISTKKATKYEYFINYRQDDENSTFSLLNCLFNSSKLHVETNRSKLITKYYVDILVTDNIGNPINNANVYITNINSSSYDYQPQVPYEYDDYISDAYGPGIGGAYDYPAPDPKWYTYTGGTYKRWYNALSLSYSVTGINGHTPLPDENVNKTIILSDFVLINETGNQEQINFTYNITVTATGYNNNESVIINPDSTWYRSNESVYQNTTTIIMSSWAHNPDYVYSNVKYRWDTSGNKTIIGRDPLDTDTVIGTSFEVRIT